MELYRVEWVSGGIGGNALIRASDASMALYCLREKVGKKQAEDFEKKLTYVQIKLHPEKYID